METLDWQLNLTLLVKGKSKKYPSLDYLQIKLLLLIISCIELSVELQTTLLQKCCAKKATALKWISGQWVVFCEYHSFLLNLSEISCITLFPFLCRFTLLVGHPPFETQTLKDTYTKIKKNEYHIPSRIGHQARTLIIAMLQADPASR